MEVRRGADRPVTRGPGRETAHSFSFGSSHDPANLSFGPLTALNDERVQPGAGYPDHRHEDVEILTWVVTGALTHHSVHADRVIGPGEVQVQAAGAGVVHRETVAAAAPPTRFVQCWLRTEGEVEPSYAVARVEPTAAWTPLAGLPGSPRLHSGARAWAARLGPAPLPLPPAGRRLLLVVSGTAVLVTAGGDVALVEGDDARLTDAEEATVSGPADVLLWALPPDARTPDRR